MGISYRMANDADINAMAQFWSENSGWDIIDDTEWKRRFTNTPFGDAVVSLATDEETKKIIGQFVFIPVTITLSGKEVKAYRPFAPILQETLQSKFGIASLLTGQHPILKMYRKVAADLTQQGVSLIYIIPDPRWARILQNFPIVMTHKFPLWSFLLPLNKNFQLAENITVEKINPADSEVDLLWQEASVFYSTAIVRNSKTLLWKTSHGDYKVFAIRRNNQIIGWFAVIYKLKDHQWLICDMVTKDQNEILDITLKAACNIIQEEDKKLLANDGQKNKIALLATSLIEPIVKKMGFLQENYYFTLAVHLLNKNGIDKNNIAPSNWYVSAND